MRCYYKTQKCGIGLIIKWYAVKKLILEAGKIKPCAVEGKIFAKMTHL